VKLLFDQNLSPRLAPLLDDLFPGSQHVQPLGLGRALDIAIWDFARDNDFLIVTKDVDFSDRSAIAGFPPKIIWIRLGNCTTSEVESAIRNNHQQIEAFGNDESLGVLALLG
jgi:predicted nuclease of predicted toxin-antitoxin system